MPTNPWLSLDAAALPALRARELRRSWDAYLSGGLVDQVRVPIIESWRRSQAAGLDASASRAPTIAGRRDVSDRWQAHPLEAAAPLIRRWLGGAAAESEHLIVVSDADGLLLWLDGDARVRSAAADRMNFVEGALWSETGAGTNAIGVALAADHAVQVHAAEHFSEVVHAWTCSAAPVHDPEDGRLLGVIDLTGLMSKAHPHTLAAALAAARAVEADLRVRAQVRDARLRVRYLQRMAAGGRLALVSRSGRVIADLPDGLLRGAGRLEVPPGGGAVVLPGGRRGVAEPLDREDAYLVRALREPRLARAPRAPCPRPAVEEPATEQMGDLTGWRRAQLELSRLAEEQAALRRVATLVAGEATADEIFAAVAEEVAQLLAAQRGAVCRYEQDGSMTVVAYWAPAGGPLAVGTRVKLEGDGVAALVQQSGQPGRIESYEGLSGPVIDLARTLGAGRFSTVGAPILAVGRVWGVIIVSSTTREPLAGDAESRLMGFAELAGTAISNAVAREELNASRARVVAAADETRRRIQRDLHDGAQQRLASLVLELRAASADDEAGPPELRDRLIGAANAVAVALDDVREIAHGIHPATLSKGGLAPALRELSGRSALPVELDVSTPERFAERLEVAAYYVISELLTNATKHAHASSVRIAVQQVDGSLHLSVRDDGAGGADPASGSGLIGLRDRVEAVGGTIAVDSPAGRGTTVLVSMPLD
jgi:signal transduction histidine kinase